MTIIRRIYLFSKMVAIKLFELVAKGWFVFLLASFGLLAPFPFIGLWFGGAMMLLGESVALSVLIIAVSGIGAAVTVTVGVAFLAPAFAEKHCDWGERLLEILERDL